MPKGLSIHIGINKVSPTNYKQVRHLNACENDAKAMQLIALSQGFSTSLILSQEATSKNFYRKLNHDISLLNQGDILFISFSGHGGSIKDWSGDEMDGKDETWCLYDKQLVDDELFALLCKAPPKTRVLIISDSCHSGTMLKNSTNLFAKTVFDKRIKSKENTRQFKASVRLLSGCQDKEYSIEKDNHGIFTKALIEVWNGGKFKGKYENFHQDILKKIPFKQRPNHLILGPLNVQFDTEIPFSI